MSALQDHHEDRLFQLQIAYQERLQTHERQLLIFQQAENAEGASLHDDQTLLLSELTICRQRETETNNILREQEKQIHLLNRQLEKFKNSPRLQRRNGEQVLKEICTQTEQETIDNDGISTLSSQNQQLIEKIRNIESQLSLKNEEINELSAEKENLDSSLVELDGQHEEEINAVLMVKEELVSSNKTISSRLEETLKQNEALQAEVQNLTEQLLINTQTKDKINADESETRMKDIALQLRQISADNENLEEKLKRSEEERRRLGRLSIQNEGDFLREREHLEKELMECKSRVKELESIVLEKDDKVSGDTAEFISGNTDANTMIQQMSSENENLQNEADDLRTKLRGNAREMDALKMEIETLKIENDKIRDQLDQRNAVVEGLEDSLEQSEKTHAKKIAETEELVSGLEEKLDLLSKDDTLAKSIVVERDSQTEDGSPDYQNTSTETEKSTDTKVSSSQTETEELAADRDKRLSEMSNYIQILENQIKEMTVAQNNASEEMGEKDNYITERDSLINKLEAELGELQSMIHTVRSESQSKTDEYQRSYGELERHRTQLSDELNRWMHKYTENEKIISELRLIQDDLRSELNHPDPVEEKQEHDQSEKDVNDMRNVLRQKDAEISSLNHKIESFQFSNQPSDPEFVARNNMEMIKSLENEKERLITVLNEKSRECSSLKGEVHRLFGVVSAEKQAFSKLQQDNHDLSNYKPDETEKEMSKEAMQNLARIIKDKDFEIDSLKQKNETLLAVMHQSNAGQNENNLLEKLMSEKDDLTKQLQMYQTDREQITKLLNQKHQESLMYHAEMQKLNSQLIDEKRNYVSLKEQHQSVSLLFEEKQKSLLNTQNEVVSLKQRVTELERHQTDLSHKYSDLIDKNCETVQINREEWVDKQRVLDDLQTKMKQYEELINEKDKMIYQLNHSFEETSLIQSRKEEMVKTLQHRLDEVTFKFSEAEMKLKETAEEDANSSDDLVRLRMENEALQEENKSLTMSFKQSQFEKDSMKEKMTTLVQLVQEKDVQSDQSGRSTSSAQLLQDFAVLEEKMGGITQERDQALLALSQQQQDNKNQIREQKKLQEQNEKLHSELDRLRNHLLEIQDNYTQEIMSAEDREKTLRIKLASAEDRASLSSNAIANASMESQTRVDSLQQQLSQVLRQRDSSLEQCSRLEDQIQQLKAAITNLQSALECIQGEHRRELIQASKASQEKLRQREKDIDLLKDRIVERETRLKETMEALDAASRLSEQLDKKEKLINELRNEVTERQRLLQKARDEIQELESNSEGKVDKQIMKSLVLGYFASPASQKSEVVRLLARILDFNQVEMEKAGVKIGREMGPSNLSTPNRSGWISSFIGKVVPSPSPQPNPTIPVSSTVNSSNPNQSFSTLFVEFLKNESQPTIPARMPLESMGSSGSNSILTTTRKPLSNPSKTTVKLDFFSPAAGNLVTGSALNHNEHPLMRPLSTALPTFTPILSSESAPNKNATFLEEVLK